MSRGLRVAGFAALLLAAAALAFGPLARAGFVGEDLTSLVRAAGSPADAVEGTPVAGGALAHLSLRLSHALWARDGAWGERAALALRIENVLFLLGSAAFARLALRRTLAPWTGMEGARAAAGACALLLACHPLAVPAVASPAARGELLGLFLGTAAAAAFLRGRQEREAPWIAVAGLCVLGAACAAPSGVLVPVLLAILELFSGRRGRPRSVRCRTAATTLAAFGALWLAARLAGGSAPLAFPAGDELGPALRAAGRDLGRIALPAPAGSGVPGLIAAGAVVLLGLHPAIVAARSAPRLWGWLTITAVVGPLLAVLVRAAAPHAVEGPLSGSGLVTAALLACAVLAIAATSLSGLRRVLLPAVAAGAFALLARAATTPWIEASAPLSTLRADLARTRAEHGSAARILLVDPPGPVAGLEVAGPALPLLLDPSLCAAPRRAERATLAGLSRRALLALVREPEFTELRTAGLVLLLPDPTGAPGAPRTALAVSPPRATSGALAWREDLRSPRFDLDPLERRALRAEALPDAPTAQAPRMSWRAGEASAASPSGSRSGVWVAGGDAPTAVFDLSTDPDWLFGDLVHRAWLEPPIGRIASAELARDVLPLPAKLVSAGEGTLVFRLDAGGWPRPVHGESRLVLALLDLRRLRYAEVAAPLLTDPATRELAFPLPADFVDAARAGGSGLAWSLELASGDACFARASGRL